MTDSENRHALHGSFCRVWDKPYELLPNNAQRAGWVVPVEPCVHGNYTEHIIWVSEYGDDLNIVRCPGTPEDKP